MSASVDDVLEFWFGTLDEHGAAGADRSQRWFGGDAAFDAEIRERFADDVRAALRGEREGWAATPRGRVALLILLDQFTRNAFRGTRDAFAGDARALAHARAALAAGEDARLAASERYFLWMPLMHAEDRDVQAQSVACFEALAAQATGTARPLCEAALDFARKHRDVVERFGRFPSRNAILGRSSTAEEAAFLEQHGAGF